jgi:hypothetical protein
MTLWELYLHSAKQHYMLDFDNNPFTKAKAEFNRAYSVILNNGHLKDVGEWCFSFTRRQLLEYRKEIVESCGIPFSDFTDFYQNLSRIDVIKMKYQYKKEPTETSMGVKLSYTQKKHILAAIIARTPKLNPDMLLRGEKLSLRLVPSKLIAKTTSESTAKQTGLKVVRWLITTFLTSMFAINLSVNWNSIGNVLLSVLILVMACVSGWQVGMNIILVTGTANLYSRADYLCIMAEEYKLGKPEHNDIKP